MESIDADGILHSYPQAASDCLFGRGSKVTPVGGIDILSSFLTVNKKLPADAATNIKTFTQDTMPVNPEDDLTEGDMWINTDEQNIMYIFNGAVWVRYRDAGISAALEAAANFELTQDGKTVALFQDNQPNVSSAKANDYWFDTSTTPEDPYVYDGNSYTYKPEDQLAKALLLGSTPSAIADGKLIMYYAANEPKASPSLGDLWYSTATKNVSRWSGAKWIVESVVGTSWDDVDGDGRPDSYVGNTGKQLLADYNFERSLAGDKVWQGLVTTGVPDRELPYGHLVSDKVLFSSTAGEDGSAGCIMKGAGLNNFTNLYSPQLYAAHAGDSFVTNLRLKTNQPGTTGNAGVSIICTYYNSNFQIVGQSDLTANEYGPVWNPSTNFSWHTQNIVTEIPVTLSGVAWLGFCVCMKSTEASVINISKVEMIRERIRAYEFQMPNQSFTNLHAEFDPPTVRSQEIRIIPVEFSAGEEVLIGLTGQIRHGSLLSTTSIGGITVSILAREKSSQNEVQIGSFRKTPNEFNASNQATYDLTGTSILDKTIDRIRFVVFVFWSTSIPATRALDINNLVFSITSNGIKGSGYE